MGGNEHLFGRSDVWSAKQQCGVEFTRGVGHAGLDATHEMFSHLARAAANEYVQGEFGLGNRRLDAGDTGFGRRPFGETLPIGQFGASLGLPAPVFKVGGVFEVARGIAGHGEFGVEGTQLQVGIDDGG